ncbi:MAG: DUF2163 domain-containing protein [Proteobacteria bacterium]|nr:DUF2163 domain-containing protein [Pseudomonadota bacterium]
MRTLPEGLQAHLDSGTTGLCHCWKLMLASGETLGFTDHDRTLSFAGTSFEAAAGFSGSEIESSLGLSVDNLEASGALQSGLLDEARLRAGDFDHAAIEIWRVNWQEVSQRVLLRKGHLGEVTYGGTAFTAEVRGLAHLMNQPKGRLYQHGCDAMLGDSRCKVNAAAFSETGTILAAAGASLTAAEIAGADERYSRGTISFLSGAGMGRTLTIRRHRKVEGQAKLELQATPAFAVLAGDTVKLVAGCDKQLATCRAKFANAANYRGFPHMPGTDFVAAFPRTGDPALDGGRRG